MIVVDASVAVEVLFGATALGARAAARLRAEQEGLAAPHLIDAEVGQVLRRLVRAGQVSQEDAQTALADLALLPLVRYPHTPLLMRAFELREDATFFDALYLALAERLDAHLLTRDVALASIPGHRAHVEVLR